MNENAATLRLSGGPIGLSTIVREAAQGPVSVAWTSETNPSAKGDVHAGIAPVDSDMGLLRIHLPRSTPPGEYEAVVKIGDQERSAVIEVQPDVHLRIFPERLIVAGAADDVVQRDVSIFNLGNVDITVPDVAGFGVYENEALDRAIGEMFRDADTAGDERPVDVLFERAREGHGGLVRMKIDGAGTLAPGQSRDLKLILHLPGEIRPGRTYVGMWALYQSRYYVQIEGTEKRGTAS